MASNGGSLEDCFSNVFALTELNGLKWRCFLTPQNAPRGVPIPSDPVLKAYGRCLQDGFICTWRRKPLQIPAEGPEPLPLPSFTNDISKELWLFWYSSEPPEGISEYTSHLEGDESGVGSALNGISYEVRVLFFKALHTGIERSVTKAGFVRFGRWFTRPLRQPLSGRQHLLSHYVLAFNMQFFIHGGNTVCMTLNAQRQPPLLRLAKRHLECGRRVQVVVGPWSLRAVLLPGDSDAGRNQASADRQWEEWKEFVALGHDPEDDDESREEGVPRMVTLELDGIRMLYPSCYVCVTMEDDATSCPKDSQSTPVPPMTPDELITSDNGRRNRLLVSNVNGQMYMQGVLQNAHLSRRNVPAAPAASQNGPFQAPYPPQSDDETKWNFVDPCRPDTCACDECKFQPSAEYWKSLEKQKVEDVSTLYTPIRMANMKCTQLKTNPAYNLLRKQVKRKSKYSYHRRNCLSSTADSASLQRASSPVEDTADAEHDTSDDDVIHPAWADASKESLVTGIYCSADDASYHYGVATPCNSSDDENLACSPFTPIKVVSPCSDCAWPSAPADQISEAVFNEIFHPGNSSRVPPTASQEERQRDYDCYYNPTLREEPYYMSYHSRRYGEKRRPCYPPNIRMPLSPDQPGSQETIPATTSPPPELDDHRRRPVDSTMPLSMANRTVMKVEKEAGDEPVSSRKRPRKIRRKIEWPDLDTLDVAFMSSDVGEELKSRISPYAGRITPCIDMDSEVEMDDRDIILDKEETRAIGEGTSGLFISDGNPRCIYSTADEMMDVDDGTIVGPTDNILSPPASNERPEYAMVAVGYGWPRVGGPPSAGDPSMNHIYPTPPSVQSEAQQFSPAPVLPPHSTVINTNQPVVLDTILIHMNPHHQQVLINTKIEPQVPETLEEMEEDEQKPLVPLGSRMDNLLNRINNTPVSGYVRKQIVPSSSRFSAVDNKVALCSAIAHRRGSVQMPPDYRKLVSDLDKRVPKQLSVELLLSFPSSIASTAPSQMTPVTSFPNPGYKPNFGAISATTSAPSTLPSMGAIPPMQHQQITGFPNSQIRTPPMIVGRGISSHGPYGSPAPYGASVNIPYNTMIPQQPQNSVQQLNNFVHGPMFNGGGGGSGGMNMNMYPGPTHPQMQMMQPGYGGPQCMMNYGVNSIGAGGISPAASIGNTMMTGASSSYNGGSQTQYNQLAGPGSMQGMRPMGMGTIPQQPPLPGHMMPNSFGTGHMQVASQREGSSFAEGTSVVLAIILQDTILDLHYDSVFDACPICSCNTSIRARELGLYILPHEILRMPVSQQKEKIGPWSGFALEQANTCNCGFSAVRHRYLSLCSGLFSDDSEEATAIPIKHSVAPVNGIGDGVMQPSSQIWFDASTSTDMNMLDLLRILCQQRNMGKTVHQIAVFSEYADKAIKPQEVAFDVSSNAEFMVSKVDSAELVLIGNSAAEMALVSGSRSRSSNQPILQFFHPWGLQVANEVREPREAEWRGLLSEIGPVLEQSMRIVRCTHGSGNIVEGPLTWRSLTTKSLKSATGQEEDSFLPEPIPYINIATEKEAIRAAPQIIRHWEQMSLGPIDQPKDVLYLSVIPDNADIHAMTVKYMDQLSQMYERMRLGRHIAWVSGDNRDGCVRVGGRSGTGKYTAANTTLDFLNLVTRYVDNKVFITRLRLFTQQMEESVQQLLLDQDHMFDRAAFRETLAHDMRAKRAAAAAIAQSAERSAEGLSQSFLHSQQPIVPQIAPQKGGMSATQPSPIESSSLHDLLNLDPASTSQSQPPSTSKEEPPLEPEDIPVDDYGTLPHCVVIYVFNPFTWGTEYRSGIYARVATLALMRAFNAVCVRLPPRRRHQLQLEIIGMEQVTDLLGSLPDYMNDGKSHQDVFESSGSERELFDGYMATDSLRATALSVYTQPRVLSADCIKSIQARCMTKFGPGSSLMDAIDEWERSGTAVLYKVPSNAFCLASPPFLTQKQEGGKVIQTSLDEQVLYVTYCLIGSDWLCATVTDAQGRLNDNCLINLRTRHDPNIYKYRAKTQILDAMGRLWTYIIGVLSMETRNWRLVIGRLGRIGHGEFRAWTHLLNKQALRRHSARLKEVCSSCAQMPGGAGTPAILSACLISTEPEPNLRIFPGYSSNDGYGKRVRPLSTPEDTSCTHIMVFPTGADIQLGSGDQQADGEDDFDFDTLHDIEQDGDEMGMGQDFVSSLMLDSNLDGPQPSAGFRTAGGTFFPDNAGDISVENQPLATGFYVSTSPAADLPDWFWASCPGAKRRAPVHLKSSLHINVPLVQQEDEYLRGKSGGNDKMEKESPLDSARTDEVLRHVLETYNALSWLSVDLVSGERRSCLPIHIQALLRLYHSVCRLIM